MRIVSPAGLLALCIILMANSAQAQMSIEQPAMKPPVLPPVEYDHPYKGRLVVTRADRSGIRKSCPNTFFPPLGCAYRHATSCKVVLATDELIRAAGEDPDIVWRHEIGHCNGWPTDHRGARYLEQTPTESPEPAPGQTN
jgi:hypothetical protein